MENSPITNQESTPSLEKQIEALNANLEKQKETLRRKVEATKQAQEDEDLARFQLGKIEEQISILRSKQKEMPQKPVSQEVKGGEEKPFSSTVW